LVSLPNVAYLDNRLGLLNGKWNYTDEGILDRTHLKFFTLSTAEKLLSAAGFRKSTQRFLSSSRHGCRVFL